MKKSYIIVFFFILIILPSAACSAWGALGDIVINTIPGL